ncbi:hypothetical protein Nepgr_018704 [Nepenthes gracilis]|uniref:Uncharacterized protein n=1 Tax=Nepenthes gracilis TaxID=150966 RepID=A0AAD3SRU7_NEPGR|nr:hypothetical protein Nepgr_018704 [Nepenthes gracilis]
MSSSNKFAVLQSVEIIKATGESVCNQDGVKFVQHIATSYEHLSWLRQLDHGSDQGEVSVGPVDPVSQADCADEIKAQNEAFCEAAEQPHSTQCPAIYLGVHNGFYQEDISKERHHDSDAARMTPRCCQPVLGPTSTLIRMVR